MDWKGYEAGKRVVCISDGEGWRGICSVVPRKGRIYTIRAAEMGENVAGEVKLGLQFVEFASFRIGQFAHFGGEWFFSATDFKPIDESRIDVFRQHLVGDIWKQPVAA